MEHLCDCEPLVKNTPLHFNSIQTATFIDRPNRFLVRCHVDRVGVVTAFLPNPGRLWELLLPEVRLYVTPNATSDATQGPHRKTQHTVLAVEREGAPVFLHTHLTNQVARYLIEERRIPGLEEVEVVRAEVPHGNSRFDFLLRRRGRDLYAEVKSCTLFANGVAMFPDAVTERGRRHLLELAALRRQGIQSVVLFVVQTPSVRWFMPDYHTDLAFSETLLDVRRDVRVIPVSIGWESDLSLAPGVRILDIPWSCLRREVKDRGSYLLLVELKSDRRITIGRLGDLHFRKGHYVYVGSAMRNLSARVARHSRVRKKLRWHLDYLRQEADSVTPVPIRSSQRLECEIARAMASLLESGPEGFGASDCDCPTHLFWHPTNPLQSPPFHGVLQRFRMRPPTSTQV